MHYFPWQKKEIIKARIKAFLYGFVIAALIFCGLGYQWRLYHEKEIVRELDDLRIRINKMHEALGDAEAKKAIKELEKRKFKGLRIPY